MQLARDGRLKGWWDPYDKMLSEAATTVFGLETEAAKVFVRPAPRIRWRYSLAGEAAVHLRKTVSMPRDRDLSEAAWQKSTRSDANGSCVEVVVVSGQQIP